MELKLNSKMGVKELQNFIEKTKLLGGEAHEEQLKKAQRYLDLKKKNLEILRSGLAEKRQEFYQINNRFFANRAFYNKQEITEIYRLEINLTKLDFGKPYYLSFQYFQSNKMYLKQFLKQVTFISYPYITEKETIFLVKCEFTENIDTSYNIYYDDEFLFTNLEYNQIISKYLIPKNDIVVYPTSEKYNYVLVKQENNKTHVGLFAQNYVIQPSASAKLFINIRSENEKDYEDIIFKFNHKLDLFISETNGLILTPRWYNKISNSISKYLSIELTINLINSLDL